MRYFTRIVAPMAFLETLMARCHEGRGSKSRPGNIIGAISPTSWLREPSWARPVRDWKSSWLLEPSWAHPVRYFTRIAASWAHSLAGLRAVPSIYELQWRPMAVSTCRANAAAASRAADGAMALKIFARRNFEVAVREAAEEEDARLRVASRKRIWSCRVD